MCSHGKVCLASVQRISRALLSAIRDTNPFLFDDAKPAF
jgi:hypothetical protein